MGNEQSKTKPNIQIQVNHPKIHSFRILNENKQRHMQVLFGTEENQFKKWKSNLDNAKLDRQFLLLPIKNQFVSKGLCGNSGSLTIDYQNYPYLLTQEIQNRIGKKKLFQQTELWYLLFALVQSQSQLRSYNNSKVGDIRPINVFLNEQGHVKIANLLSWPGQVTNYQKSLQNQTTYLAPEDVGLLKMGQLQNQANIHSQIFSIGLSILSTANLADYSDDLYNMKSKTFDQQYFSKIVDEWRVNETYSDIFKATIASLLQVNPKNRLEEKQLCTWISQYEKNIKAREDFVITNPPLKIINEIQIIKNLYGNGGFVSGINSQLPIEASLNNFRLSGQDYRLSSEVRPLFPIQGSRRLVQERRLPLVSTIPGVNPAESSYTPLVSTKLYSNNVNTKISYSSPQKVTVQGGDSHLKNYILQGMPMGNNLTYVSRTSNQQQIPSKHDQEKVNDLSEAKKE